MARPKIIFDKKIYDSDIQSTSGDDEEEKDNSTPRIGEVIGGLYHLYIPVIACVGMYIYYRWRRV